MPILQLYALHMAALALEQELSMCACDRDWPTKLKIVPGPLQKTLADPGFILWD